MDFNKRPLVIDDGRISILAQAQMLTDDAGTEREWIAVGSEGESNQEKGNGPGEVILLCHPDNAPYIVMAVNHHAELVRLVAIMAEDIDYDDQGNAGYWQDGLFYAEIPEHVLAARAILNKLKTEAGSAR